jgi:hypothetical protein
MFKLMTTLFMVAISLLLPIRAFAQNMSYGMVTQHGKQNVRANLKARRSIARPILVGQDSLWVFLEASL